MARCRKTVDGRTFSGECAAGKVWGEVVHHETVRQIDGVRFRPDEYGNNRGVGTVCIIFAVRAMWSGRFVCYSRFSPQ
jgi:hypothetical protein